MNFDTKVPNFVKILTKCFFDQNIDFALGSVRGRFSPLVRLLHVDGWSFRWHLCVHEHSLDIDVLCAGEGSIKKIRFSIDFGA